MVTGAAGFIAGHLLEDLLATGYEVVGLDNYSKYGEVRRSFYNHPRFSFVRGDAKDVGLLKELAGECDPCQLLAHPAGDHAVVAVLQRAGPRRGGRRCALEHILEHAVVIAIEPAGHRRAPFSGL